MKARWILALLALTFLSGCSVTRLAYNNADVVLRWQSNHYFDFQGEQSDDLDRALVAVLAWHRSAALPQYAKLAGEAAARVSRGIRQEDLDWSYDAVRAQVREALGIAAGEAGVIAAKQDIASLMQALRLYRLDNQRYPTTEQGLQALVARPASAPLAPNWKAGGYLERLPKDPWGNPYQYLNPGVRGELDVFSTAADGAPGGEGNDADIGSWNL